VISNFLVRFFWGRNQKNPCGKIFDIGADGHGGPRDLLSDPPRGGIGLATRLGLDPPPRGWGGVVRSLFHVEKKVKLCFHHKPCEGKLACGGEQSLFCKEGRVGLAWRLLAGFQLGS